MDNRWTLEGAAISLDIPSEAQCGGRKGFGSGSGFNYYKVTFKPNSWFIKGPKHRFQKQIPCAREQIVSRPGAAGAVLQAVL